jgi:hypothetical protein
VVDVGAAFEEQQTERGVAVFCRDVERRVAQPVARFEARSLVEQRAHRSLLTAARSLQEFRVDVYRLLLRNGRRVQRTKEQDG